jgi:quercetin dioxygenase-like cupin family protein
MKVNNVRFRTTCAEVDDHKISYIVCTLGIFMNEWDWERRSFLIGASGVGVHMLMSRMSSGGAATHGEGLVLTPQGGEHLIHFRDGGNIFIKFGSATGSENIAMGTQEVKSGSGIPVHRHPHMDEAFHIAKGGGVVTLNDVPHNIEEGGTIFIPRNTWHGFQNPDHELLLLWVVTPSGLDSFFRETCSPPGVPPKQLSKNRIREIAYKYGTEFR